MERIDSLQGVRAIAFLGVYLYHAIRTFPGEGVFYTFFSTGLGPWGVSVFFVLSGFLMTYSYWNRPPKKSLKNMSLFAVSKIKRLYPLHLVMLLFGSVYLLMGHENILVIIKRLIITVPLMQTWFPSGYQSINSVAWYLSVSLFLYFVFPYFLPIIKNGNVSHRIIVILAIYVFQVIIGYCVSNITYIDVKWITYCHPLYRIGDFAIGGLMAAVYINISNDKQLSLIRGSLLEILALLCNIVVCACYSIVSSNASWFAYSCLYTPTSVMLIYILSQNSGAISKLLNNKVIFWLASISPYAFLIHRIFIYYFHAFTVHLLHWEQTSFIIVIFVPFVATVIATYLYLVFEKAINMS